jgi:ribosomal protein S14
VRAKSTTRKKREAEAKPVRDALRTLGHCEICGDSRSHLDVHEICRGSYRQAALDKPFALLLVCRKCHEELGSAKEWPEARQLSVLAKSRPSQFNLLAYLALTSPKAPRRIEIEEIMEFMEEDYLTKQDVAKRLQVDRRSVQNWIDSGQLRAIDCRTVGASRPLYRVAWSNYLDFCKSRSPSKT